MKVGIIGNKEAVIGFKSLGVEVIGFNDKKTFEENLNEIKKQDFGIVFITEDFAEGNENVLAKADQDVTPAFIIIPGIKESQGIGIKKLKKTIEQAIGSDILNQ